MINDGFLLGFLEKSLIQDAPWVKLQISLLVSKINPKKYASSNSRITVLEEYSERSEVYQYS